MATYSNNTTIKIGSQGTISQSVPAGTNTIVYTVPANSYFLISGYTVPSTSSCSITVNNILNISISGDPDATFPGGIIVSAGSTIYCFNGLIVPGTFRIFGQLFTNTP
jgi:hypothetical protein